MRTPLRFLERGVPWWELVIGLWLLALAIPPALALESLNVMQAGIVLILFSAASLSGGFHFLYGPIYRHYPSVLLTSVAFAGMLALSAVLSEDPLISMAFVVMMALVLCLCGGVWEVTRGAMMTCLRVYGAAGTFVVLYYYLNREEYSVAFNGRLSLAPTSHPNYLGLIALGFLGASLAFKNPYVLGALASVNVLAMIAAQSRAALASALTTLVVYLALVIWTNRKHRSARTAALILIAGTAIATLPLTYDWIAETVNAIFLLTDRYRGYGSGFSGRIEVWKEAADLFLENPLFGVGFRMHERYMVTMWSAHNGYLSILADTGIAGTVPAFLLLFILARRALRMAVAGNRQARIAVSFCAGYCVIAMFERVFLNAGNPTSLLMWILLMMPAEGPGTAARSARFRQSGIAQRKFACQGIE